MGYFTDTYLDHIRPVLLDWLTNSGRGKNVTDLALSLANRAQKNLWAKKAWCDLVTDASISLSSGSFTFPANFGRIIDIWGNLDGTGVPSYWYYEADSYEKGYKLRDSFTAATGHAWTITFHYPQSDTQMRYQRLLSDFTGNGTEYSFFPSNLLILECQKINTRDKGNTKEWQMIKADWEEEFKDFCNCHQWVNYDPTPKMRDRNGSEIITNEYSLDGSDYVKSSSLPNSFIL